MRAIWLLPCLMGCALGQTLPQLDLTQAAAVKLWQPTHDLAAIEATPAGMKLAITGGDPYSVGPALDFPTDLPLWLTIRLKSDAGGTGQLFYGATGFVEERSAHFSVPAGQWHEALLPLPPLGPGCHLRLDPPGTDGTCTVSAIRFAKRRVPTAPAWPQPTAPAVSAADPQLISGNLTLRHRQDQFGGFELSVDGVTMATGQTRDLLGYSLGEQARWLDLAREAKVKVSQTARALTTVATLTDPDGATWTLERVFTAKAPGAIAVAIRVSVDRERSIDYLPVLTLFPGLGSYGTARDQGLLAGVEYLDRPDTSSSEADLEGPQSQRQVTDTARITFPLMAIGAKERWVALAWRKQGNVCAAFDTPDRLYRSGAATMGLLFPGSDGFNRPEDSLLPYHGEVLRPGAPLSCEATLLGGAGKSIIGAVQAYVALHPLPPVPAFDADAYLKLATAGWLDSQIREGDQYRHAWWPGITSFKPQPAADASCFQDWLALRTHDAATAARLRASAQAARELVPKSAWLDSGVSHVRYPLTPLLYGGVPEMVEAARSHAQGSLPRFSPDGGLIYHAPAEGPDFGRTHFSQEANGLAAPVVCSVLQAALLTGDANLTREALRVLHALDRFDDTVPRGAQTWECPLHSPDILASAYLVRAYTMGYELTGEQALLDRAVYWAWTGVPFTYLVNPTAQPVGLYATTPVLCATHWKSPNWIGLPVQWCGLVYSDALWRLARYDIGPWRRMAEGITVSGIQQSFPGGKPELAGLLPDSFVLKSQSRNPVAINPGTVQANAMHLLAAAPPYDYVVERELGLTIHAAAGLTVLQRQPNRLELRLKGWNPQPTAVLVAGAGPAWKVLADGRSVEPTRGANWLSVSALSTLTLLREP